MGRVSGMEISSSQGLILRFFTTRGNFFPGKILAWEEITISSRVTSAHDDFTEKNIGFPNGPSFRYGNFFIPRVEKTSKNEPTGKKLWLPRAVGPREAMLFSHGLILRFFSTRGMKKFPYLKPTAHSEIVFLFVSIYAHPAKKS